MGRVRDVEFTPRRHLQMLGHRPAPLESGETPSTSPPTLRPSSDGTGLPRQCRMRGALLRKGLAVAPRPRRTAGKMRS